MIKRTAKIAEEAALCRVVEEAVEYPQIPRPAQQLVVRVDGKIRVPREVHERKCGQRVSPWPLGRVYPGERFAAAADRVRNAYGEEFRRAWELYLAGSQAAFATGWMQLFQVVFVPRESAPPSWTRGDRFDIPRVPM